MLRCNRWSIVHFAAASYKLVRGVFGRRHFCHRKELACLALCVGLFFASLPVSTTVSFTTTSTGVATAGYGGVCTFRTSLRG